MMAVLHSSNLIEPRTQLRLYSCSHQPLVAMLRFTTTDQAYPEMRPAASRALDFNEISAAYDPAAAATQASRCSQCGVPFCQIHCPLSNNIPDWLKLAAEGRLEEAYAVSSATNSFPEICGRICPQDRLCEGNCVIEKDFGAVTIGAVEKYITETAFDKGWVKPIHVKRASGFSIGIIGAGPAGLAAADALRRQGHAVTVYDRYDRTGGLMMYGIPNFKLDKKVVQRREKLLRDGGIKFVLNARVGETISLAELRTKHDAVLIATGVYKARELGLSGDTLAGIIPAMDYLTTSNRKGLGDAVATFDSGVMNAHGKHVVVIGGGDTAMDCVRTAVRQGAASVTCLYRRDRANMPGSAREVGHAEAEGVQFEWLAAPHAFVGDTAVRGVVVQRMMLASKEEGDRQRVVAVAGDTYERKADMVIKALGFDAEDLPALFGEPALTTTPYGTLTIDKNFMTALPNMFAAGDIVRGASLVVWAIRDGRDAAAAIHRHLLQAKDMRHVG
jgi:glutamate synthase (NADPH/NADH) small chain